jgi:hypothetical protein
MEAVLIFGPPTRPPQVGRLFPEMRFALVAPRPGVVEEAVLHVMGCSQLPFHTEGNIVAGREVVYSTTLGEIDDYAAGRFGEDGWVACLMCVGGWER